MLYGFKNTKLIVSTSNRQTKNLLDVKVHNTSEFCWYWLSAKLQWTKTTWIISRLGIFSSFFVFLNIYHWIRTVRQLRFIILRWIYCSKFIVFILLSYIFSRVINRATCLFELLEFNPCDKFSPASVLLRFYVFMTTIFTLVFLRSPIIMFTQLVLFCIVSFTNTSLRFMIKSFPCFKLVSTFLAKSNK